jgi:hypothetical protein
MTEDPILLPFRAQIPLHPASSRALELPDRHWFRLLNNIAVGSWDRLHKRFRWTSGRLKQCITAASRKLRLLDVVMRMRRIEVIDKRSLRRD